MDMAGTPLESRDVARASMMLAMTRNRQEESAMLSDLQSQGLMCAASDYGGDYLQSVPKIVERAVQCARRAGMIQETVHDEGTVAGAAREALNQISDKALAAFYDRIEAASQNGDVVSITNVVELVDRGIKNANKFFRRIGSSRKRYDEMDRVILKEKDFR